MKQLDLCAAPPGFFVWKYPKDRFDAPHSLNVPLGMEAVVIRDGEMSDPYRAGDMLTVGARPGLFRRKESGREEVYLCRKDLREPVRWGLGGVQLGEASGNETFGASGKMRLSVSNARLVVRNLVVGLDFLDEKTLGKRLEPIIIQYIRPALAEAVKRTGIREAGARLDALSTQTGDSVMRSLQDTGLKLEQLTVETLVLR